VPEVIASRKELSAALSGGRSLRLFRGWRRELIGEDLLRIL
jgi:ribonuclease D